MEKKTVGIMKMSKPIPHDLQNLGLCTNDLASSLMPSTPLMGEPRRVV